jgi:methionyl aminopeptidase
MKMPSHDALICYREAGRIAARVRKSIRRSVKRGRLIIDICDKVEKMILDEGGELAFPCNVGVDQVAAHYTSPPGDSSRIPAGSLVKIDLGVHVDGYIADTATTVCLNPRYKSLVEAANQALLQAIKVLSPGCRSSQIGEVIENTIRSYRLKPVRNLSGHQIQRYVLHTGKTVPNVSGFDTQRFSEGEVYAIEPFVTSSRFEGVVYNSQKRCIFRLARSQKLRDESARHLLETVESRFRSLPFAKRWLERELPIEDLQVFDRLVSRKIIDSYPVLVEKTGGPVAQAEHTVLITEKGCEVFTA